MTQKVKGNETLVQLSLFLHVCSDVQCPPLNACNFSQTTQQRMMLRALLLLLHHPCCPYAAAATPAAGCKKFTGVTLPCALRLDAARSTEGLSTVVGSARVGAAHLGEQRLQAASSVKGA
jgi:hypothetical protein